MEQQTNHETNKSAVEFSQKSHRTSRKAQKDPNAPFVREKLTLPNGHQNYCSILAVPLVRGK
ncbi:hypothetical protein JO83_13440 [Avibacterium paragallinarum]|nr:hypothetical protein JO83_13440 [Avibacterium paragallinarum]